MSTHVVVLSCVSRATYVQDTVVSQIVCIQSMLVLLFSRVFVWRLNPSAFFFFFSSRRRHTRLTCDWSSDGVLFRSWLALSNSRLGHSTRWQLLQLQSPVLRM